MRMWYVREVKIGRWLSVRWPNEREGQDWGSGDDAPADAVTDLRTEGNRLSLWLVDDTEISRAVAALATAQGRQVPRAFGILKIPQELVDGLAKELGLGIDATCGRSGDKGLNEKSHRDLTGLSGRKLTVVAARLLCGLSRGEVGCSEFKRDKLKGIVRDAVKQGHLDGAKLPDSWKNDRDLG